MRVCFFSVSDGYEELFSLLLFFVNRNVELVVYVYDFDVSVFLFKSVILLYVEEFKEDVVEMYEYGK